MAYALKVHDTGELLDSVEKQIALLDHVLVLRILEVRPVGLDDATKLVDLGREAAGGDETAELQVEVFRADSERCRHGLEGDGLVRIKELLVSQNVQLAHYVAAVGLEVAVGHEDGLEVDHGVEVTLVVAVVEGLYKTCLWGRRRFEVRRKLVAEREDKHSPHTSH
jgi:hypothetical protein